MRNRPPFYPNTFILGAPKCGTTSIASFVATHPHGYTCTPKEPFYWCDDFPPSAHEPRFSDIREYEAIFSKADPDQHVARVDASTRYLYSGVAIPRILDYAPEAKFIICVRNPIELSHAYHMEQVYSLHEDIPDFEEAWHAQELRRQGKRIPQGCAAPPLLQYGHVAAVGAQVERAISLIPRGNLHIVFLEDMREAPRMACEQIQEFLGLPIRRDLDLPQANAAHAHRFELIARLVLNPPRPIAPAVRAVRRILSEGNYAPIVAAKRWLNPRRDRPRLSPSFRDTLRTYFHEDIMRLSRITGRQLDHWLQ